MQGLTIQYVLWKQYTVVVMVVTQRCSMSCMHDHKMHPMTMNNNWGS